VKPPAWLVLAVFTTVAAAQQHPTQQHPTPQPTPQPTARPAPEPKRNAKQHEWATPGRIKGRGNKLGVGSAFLESTVKTGELIELEEFACQAPAIVVGTAVSGQSATTSDGAVIFTDYVFQIEETIRIPARPRARMEVTRVGGVVSTATGSKSFKSRMLPPLELGQKYLLFLSRVTGSPTAFAADIPGGTLRITQSGSEQVDEVSFVKGLPRRGSTVPTDALLGDVRIAARSCAARPGQVRRPG
jgi:hypothetical protein